MKKTIRVLLAKVGLDCHTRGINVISMALKNGGMEVIYLGAYQSPDAIVKAAIEEGVDVIGISSLSGGHMLPFSEIGRILKEKQIHDVLLIGGGFIPQEDADVLRSIGISRIFGPGTSTESVITFIRNSCDKESKECSGTF